MTIHFYLDGEEEKEIVTLYDMISNPFKVGDEISLNVEELYPKDLIQYNTDFQDKMRASVKKLEEDYKFKTIKIIREGKYIRITLLSPSKITIEYHCEFINN